MIFEPECRACNSFIWIEQGIGEPIQQANGEKHYVNVECPDCGEKYALVFRHAGVSKYRVGVMYRCTFNDEPCGKPSCSLCLQGDNPEYNELYRQLNTEPDEPE